MAKQPSPTQDRVLKEIIAKQGYGATWKEIAPQLVGLGHAEISAALSALHKKGVIAKLVATASGFGVRDGCAVYVAPDFVTGRPTEEYGARQRSQWSPDHPCFNGRPILIGDRIQFADQLHGGALTDGRVIEIRQSPEEGSPWMQVDELGGWLIEAADVLDHTPKRG